MLSYLCQNRVWIGALVGIGMMGNLLTTCGKSPIGPSLPPTQAYLAQFLLGVQDVPSQWFYSGDILPVNVVGADALSTHFNIYGSSVSFGQYLSVYPTALAATEAYDSATQTAYKKPADALGFSYQPKADKYVSFCIKNVLIANTNERVAQCTIYLLYGRAFTTVGGDIDGKFITVEQVDKILERVDAKLLQFSENAITPNASPLPPATSLPQG